MFKVGDKVVYPMHGAGAIQAIEEKEIMGSIQTYYVIIFEMNQLQMMIPVKKVAGLGMRFVSESSAMEDMMPIFQQKDIDRSLTFKQRFKENSDKMKTGKLEDGAEVIRDLTMIKKEKALNSNEKVMLRDARNFLISELQLSKGITGPEAADFLNSQIKQQSEKTFPA